MSERIFLAGASGAVGMPLVRLLVSAGYEVHGTTRSPAKAAELKAAGARPVVVDVFDAAGLSRAVTAAQPSVVIHQLTDLPVGLNQLDQTERSAALERNARIRIEGTHNLVQAALQAGASSLIAQSIAWVYAPGPEPHTESDPLNDQTTGNAGVSMRGVIALERMTLQSPPLVGTVLRYGQLYGPRTGNETAPGPISLHVDAAASGALLATQDASAGVFNFAEPNPHVSSERARRELGWDPAFRTGLTG